MVDGNALLEEFVEIFRFGEIHQCFLDIRIKTFVEHGAFGVGIEV